MTYSVTVIIVNLALKCIMELEVCCQPFHYYLYFFLCSFFTLSCCINSNWRRYKDLILIDTGLGWDHERDVPIVDDNGWNLYLQRHPDDSSLRNKPCRRYIKPCALFERNTATGSHARSSTQRPPDIVEVDQEISEDPIDLEDDYPMAGDTNLPSQSISTSSGVSKWRRGKRNDLERLIQSFETTSQAIASSLRDHSKHECKAVMNALRAITGMTVEERVKAADYYAKNKFPRLMFLECDPEERLAYVNLIP